MLVGFPWTNFWIRKSSMFLRELNYSLECLNKFVKWRNWQPRFLSIYSCHRRKYKTLWYALTFWTFELKSYSNINSANYVKYTNLRCMLKRVPKKPFEAPKSIVETHLHPYVLHFTISFRIRNLFFFAQKCFSRSAIVERQRLRLSAKIGFLRNTIVSKRVKKSKSSKYFYSIDGFDFRSEIWTLRNLTWFKVAKNW